MDRMAPRPRFRAGRLGNSQLPYLSALLLLPLLFLLPATCPAACPLPTFTVQPQSQTIYSGGSVSFSVSAVSAGCTVSYQWYGPQGPISGATGTNYTINPVSAGNAGNYYAVASVIGSSRQSSTATLTVIAPNLTPYQPPGWSDKIVVTLTPGTTTDDNPLTTTNALYVDWAVVNIGAGQTATTFANELYLDGVLQATWNVNPPMPPGTNFNAHVTGYPIGMLSTGTHTLRIKTDSANAIVESNEADNEYTKTITVLGPPILTQQPQSVITNVGATVTFSVAASGTLPLSYYWWRNGTPIAGATQSSYTINNVQLSDNLSQFSCLVSNAHGTVTSLNAVLYVGHPRVAIYAAETNLSYSLDVKSNIVATGLFNDADIDVLPSSIEAAQNMVLIPAGSFQMGDNLDGQTDALPLHVNYVSAFYMDANVVSYALWQQVYQWATNHGYSFDNAGSGKAANHPVQTINWYDAVKWCNARSEMAGLAPCYYTNTSLSQTAIYRSGEVDLATNWVNWSANGYRLPTEAEWEKAARGGASGHRFTWVDVDTIDWSRANYYAYPPGDIYDVNPTAGYDSTFNDGVFPYTSPVGYFAPNGYGLYDMAGNVTEWCWDWYGSYSSGSQSDPRGPALGSVRVLRGGPWDADARWCRAAGRNNLHSPTDSYPGFGFRCVLPSGQP
jgi:formylglycine-generating enzyme